MKNAERKRELKQFKALLWLGAIVYPAWLVYGMWSGKYDGPIIVGFISIWAVWYIKYIISKVEKSVKNEVTEINWYTLPIQQYIELSVLVLSLLAAMLLCLSLLVAVNVFKSV